MSQKIAEIEKLTRKWQKICRILLKRIYLKRTRLSSEEQNPMSFKAFLDLIQIEKERVGLKVDEHGEIFSDAVGDDEE